MHRIILALLVLAFYCFSVFANTENNTDSVFGRPILEKVSEYAQSIIENEDTINVGADAKFYLAVEKKNPLLFLVPSMFNVAHGERQYAGESTYRIFLNGFRVNKVTNTSSNSTVPKNRKVLSVLRKTIFPNIYGETIFDNFLFSPFHKYNYRLYKYKFSRLTEDRIEIVFRPKIKNTQLISGTGIVDNKTGRIIRLFFKGQLDLVKVKVEVIMSNTFSHQYLPKICDINSTFVFAGNRIKAQSLMYYTLGNSVKDNFENAMLNKSAEYNNKTKEIYRRKCIKESTLSITDKELEVNELPTQNNKSGAYIFFDFLSDCFFDNISGSFGEQLKGNFKLTPILNPLYVGYSSRKGITYKFKLSGSYAFSETKRISLIVKTGYSFKQRQFYANIPLRLTLSKWLYLESEFGSGNRMTNSEILDKIKNERYDSIRWNDLNLEYFRDMYWKFRTNITIAGRWNLRPGITYHRRSAIEKKGFYVSGKPSVYHSFSPTLQIQFQPWRYKDMIFSVDYARGIKGILKSDMNYERFETDFSLKNKLHRMCVLSFRVGYGLYTSRSSDAYFLDYANFKYENLQGGWNDEWTGDFQLLNSNWYNASKYYLRSNLTFESPLMIVSRLPIVGKYIEMERFYTNYLFTDKLHPYIEYGYGFTNRFFSMGLFLSTSNWKFDGFGIRFGMELFRDW